MTPMSVELLQERVTELEAELESQARVIETARQRNDELEARLERALRGELLAEQERDLGHKIEAQMQFRDTKLAEDLEELAAEVLNVDRDQLMADKVELVVMVMLVNKRLHEVAELLRAPILTLSLGK
jgi:hypothetical protein